jgi:hypothetical protein
MLKFPFLFQNLLFPIKKCESVSILPISFNMLIMRTLAFHKTPESLNFNFNSNREDTFAFYLLEK